MISQGLEKSLHMAFADARQRRHEFVTVEHLLLALLDEPSAQAALVACAVNVEALRNLLSAHIKQNTAVVEGESDVDTQPTPAFQRVIQRAIMHVQATKKGEVKGFFVLIAIFAEKDSDAARFLCEYGVTRLDVVNFVDHGIRKGGAEEVVRYEWTESQVKDFIASAHPDMRTRLEAFFEQGQQNARGGQVR